jgi:hypothetical protein
MWLGGDAGKTKRELVLTILCLIFPTFIVEYFSALLFTSTVLNNEHVLLFFSNGTVLQPRDILIRCFPDSADPGGGNEEYSLVGPPFSSLPALR